MARLPRIAHRHLWALGLAVAAVGVAYAQFARSRRRALPPVRTSRRWTDAAVDEQLEDSFPASDPPSWSPLSGSSPRV